MSKFQQVQVGDPVSRAGPWGPATYASSLICECGNKSFTLHYPGPYSLEGTCTACGQTEEVYGG